MGRFGRHDRRLCSLRRPIFRLLDHLRLHGDARGVSQPLLQAPVLGVQRGDPFGLLAYLLLELLKQQKGSSVLASGAANQDKNSRTRTKSNATTTSMVGLANKD